MKKDELINEKDAKEIVGGAQTVTNQQIKDGAEVATDLAADALKLFSRVLTTAEDAADSIKKIKNSGK